MSSKETFFAGANVYQFDYAESLSAGKSTEKGILPSLALSLLSDHPAGNYYLLASIDGTTAKTHYDGSRVIQSPAGYTVSPATRETTTTLLNVEGDFGMTLMRFNAVNSKLKAYTGLGYHYWRRGDVSDDYGSYREDYSWGILPVGARIEVAPSDKITIGLDASARLAFAGSMVAYTSETYADARDTKFNLGSKIGYRGQLPIIWAVSNSTSLALTPWFEISKIGQSETELIMTADGRPVILNNKLQAVNEPDSRTLMYGANFSIGFGL